MIGFGEAAHIVPAAPDGPRTRSGTKAEVTSEKNGLWLCCNCHRQVDRDSSYYSAVKLREWKALSEKEFDYDSPTLAVSLPGHHVADGLNQTPGLQGTTAKLGLHVLAGPSRGLKGVCSKMTVELLSALGAGELRGQQYYEDVAHGVPAAGMDWHSFMFDQGAGHNIYFANRRFGWLDHNPAERDRIVLLRAKAYGRLGGDELEPFTSPWNVAILRGVRLEYDAPNDYSHLLRWANVIARLQNSGSDPHVRFASAIMRLQAFHTDWAMLSLESFDNQLIATPPALLHAEPGSTHVVVAPLSLGSEEISGVYGENGYMIKVSFAENPAKRNALDRTNIHEFWNGGGGAGFHQANPEAWKQRWVRRGSFKESLLTGGAIRPGV